MATAAAIGGSLLGGYLQSRSANKAADAQTANFQKGLDWTKQVYGNAQGNFQPFIAGGQAGLSNLLGNHYEQSPGYQYLMDEGLGAVEARNANRGTGYSGGTNLDILRHAQGIAAQDYGNWWNRQMGLASLGANAAGNLGSIGVGSSAQINSAYGNIGNAQGQAAINSGNAWSNALGGIAGAIGDWRGSRSSYGS